MARFPLAPVGVLALTLLAGCEGDWLQPPPPLDAPVGDPLFPSSWVAENIVGREIVDSNQVTLEFDLLGRMTGTAGCNQITGMAERVGDWLIIERIASARRTCSPHLMDQERRFLDVLRNVQNFVIDPAGFMNLYSAGDNSPTRFRPETRMDGVVRGPAFDGEPVAQAPGVPR